MNIYCAIIAPFHKLSLELSTAIVKNGSDIVIVTKDKDKWVRSLDGQVLSHILFLDNLNGVPATVKYFFIISYGRLPSRMETVVNKAKSYSAKVINITPYKSKIKGFGYPVKNIYLGELYDTEVENLISKVIRDAVFTNTIFIPTEDFIFPVSQIERSIEEILKESFSYGHSDDVLIGSQLTYFSLISLIKSIRPYLKFKKSLFFSKPHLPQTERVVALPPLQASDILGLLEKGAIESALSKPIIKSPRKRKPIKINWKKQNKIGIGILGGAISLFVLPFFLIGIALGLLGISYKLVKAGDLNHARPLVKVSKFVSAKGENYFSDLSSFPILGRIYSAGYRNAKIVTSASNIFEDALTAGDAAYQITTNLLGHEEYDFEGLSRTLSINLDSLYKDISFFENEISKRDTFVSKIIPAKDKLTELRSLAYSADLLGANLPDILGAKGVKSYMVLFQNNMELRPTGGFIGSFAILTLRNGVLIDQNVFDVYTADGQLKGYVEPPEAIKNYLGEASWHLRDANWDPDFPTSAHKISWFLDKSLNRKVDGVIGVDLSLVKSLLDVTGPVKLADYGDEISSLNLYEKVQREVEENFFPSSRKKASYLSSLAGSLISNLTALNKSKYGKIGEIVLSKLNSHDIQVASFEPSFAETLSKLSWDGSVVPKKCLGNCDVDWVSVVESNVGVNKANYYIDRTATLNVSISGSTTHNMLSVKLENSAPPTSNFPETHYKNYIRLVVPPSATLSKVHVFGKNVDSYLQPEITDLNNRLEGGVLVDLPPGQSQTVLFTWTNKLQINNKVPGSIVVNWKKQPGIDPYPVSININKNGFLTGNQVLGYNSDLSADIRRIITW